jgi:hypothetical protein
MMRRCLVILAMLSCTAHAAVTDCLAVAPLALNVRIGTDPPRQLLLVGGDTPALRITDAATGEILWSAGGGTEALQRFPDMTAPFAGSITALDTDNDGLHDRIYAGDLAGRLWRFDLHNGAALDALVSGGIFADFSNQSGRGFRAPPDVSLGVAPGLGPWLDIALGTSAPGRTDANNRFYVVRDAAPFEAWSTAQYRDWSPLHETDLQQVTYPGNPAGTTWMDGWFVALDSGDVLTASLTVGGSASFAIADTIDATGCRAAFSLVTLDLGTGRLQSDSGGNWRRPIALDLPLTATFTFTQLVSNPAEPRASCAFGGTAVAACDMDMRPRRTWWRRSDAE